MAPLCAGGHAAGAGQVEARAVGGSRGWKEKGQSLIKEFQGTSDATSTVLICLAHQTRVPAQDAHSACMPSRHKSESFLYYTYHMPLQPKIIAPYGSGASQQLFFGISLVHSFSIQPPPCQGHANCKSEICKLKNLSVCTTSVMCVRANVNRCAS